MTGRTDLGGQRNALSPVDGPKTLKDLRSARIWARLSDELSNITKFFGDWHLARIYQSFAPGFIWGTGRTIDENSKTLDDLYQIAEAGPE